MEPSVHTSHPTFGSDQHSSCHPTVRSLRVFKRVSSLTTVPSLISVFGKAPLLRSSSNATSSLKCQGTCQGPLHLWIPRSPCRQQKHQGTYHHPCLSLVWHSRKNVDSAETWGPAMRLVPSRPVILMPSCAHCTEGSVQSLAHETNSEPAVQALPNKLCDCGQVTQPL